MAGTGISQSIAPAGPIRVAGGNCFALASQYLNDATQAFAIVQFNGILPPDPWLYGINVIKIPAANPNASGGIYDAQ